jgi:hypothetical protein
MTDDAKKIDKLDTNAAKALHGIAKKIDTVFHGLVPAEVITFLYEHAKMMAAELVSPLIGHPMPEIIVSIDRNDRRQLGHYKIGRDGLGLRWRISMNILHLGRPRGDVLSTLLHEIMHAVQHATGKPAKIANYHNAEFREWCERLGVPTDSRGHDLGITPDGTFAAYLKRHKIEGTLKLLPPKSLPKPGGSKLKKWSCQGCDEPVNVRVAIEDFDATCNLCDTAFVYADKS